MSHLSSFNINHRPTSSSLQWSAHLFRNENDGHTNAECKKLNDGGTHSVGALVYDVPKCTGGNGFYDFQIAPMDRGGGPASLLERQNHSRRF